MLKIDIKTLPIVMKLIADFKRVKIDMKILEAIRVDDQTIRLMIEVKEPPRVLH